MDEQVNELIENLEKSLDRLGLYTVARSGFLVGGRESFDEGMEITDLLRSGEITMVLDFACIIGDVAWDRSVLEPEEFAVEEELAARGPKPEDLILRALEEGMENGWNF